MQPEGRNQDGLPWTCLQSLHSLQFDDDAVIYAALVTERPSFLLDLVLRSCIHHAMEQLSRLLPCPKSSFFLFGPRGTGKSTWLRMAMPDAVFVDLLSPATSQEFAARPDRLREVVEGNADRDTFVLDEIQRVPDLLRVVHQLIEERPGRRFVLTGSSSRKLKRTGVDLLGGRALLHTCHPFLASELGDLFSLGDALQAGLVPLIMAAERKTEALRAYVGLYLREEVQIEGIVRDMGAFARFLEAISFSHASQLNIAEVARECAVSRTTVDGYVSVLEDLLVAVRLPVFAKRARRQLVSQGKFFLFDAGVFRAIRPRGPLDRPEEIDGAALEGLVFQQLRAWNDYGGGRHALSFWRTRAGLEVDFVVYGEDAVVAIEVKNTARVSPRDLRGLRAFAADYPQARLVLLHRGAEQTLKDGVLCVPCERFLRALRPCHALPDLAWRAADLH